jgi:hypothetical protein
MKIQELKTSLGRFRFSLVVGICLLAMVIFGYLLADIDRNQLSTKIAQLEESVQRLSEENEELTTTNNQQQVQLEIAQMRAENTLTLLRESQQDARKLAQQKAFYQHVVAPETTQDGFFVDGLEAYPRASDNIVEVNFVLLQQRKVKGVIKGDLTLSIAGSLNGKPVTLSSKDKDFMLDDTIRYRFKYFQTVNLALHLPSGFTPETITFETDVYQYKRKRGEYKQSWSWADIWQEAKLIE